MYKEREREESRGLMLIYIDIYDTIRYDVYHVTRRLSLARNGKKASIADAAILEVLPRETNAAQ